MKNTECYLYNTADINNQAQMLQVVYYQHFYLLKCAFLLQAGRNWVRLHSPVYTSSTEAVLAVLLFMYKESSCFVSVFSLFYIYLELFWNT